MKLFSVLCLGALCCFTFFEAQAKKIPALSKSIVVKENKNGQTIEALVGETIEVQLPGNPTTGYEWQMIGQSNNLALVTSRYLPQESKLVGSGGVYHFLLKPGPIAVGTQHLVQFAYFRRWEGVKKSAKKFSIKIRVKSASKK